MKVPQVAQLLRGAWVHPHVRAHIHTHTHTHTHTPPCQVLALQQHLPGLGALQEIRACPTWTLFLLAGLWGCPGSGNSGQRHRAFDWSPGVGRGPPSTHSFLWPASLCSLAAHCTHIRLWLLCPRCVLWGQTQWEQRDCVHFCS